MADKPEVRYVNRDGNVFPDNMFDLYSTPEGIRREVSHGKDDAGNKIWKPLRDKPRPGIELQARGEKGDNFEPVAMFDSLSADRADPEDKGFVEHYDTYVDRWAQDTSGGPSNFHGNGGGDDNPRETTKEEQQGYQSKLAEFAADLPDANVE